MEALSLLLPLMQMGMSGSQSMLNTGLGLVPTAISLYDRFRARTDPLMRQFSEIIAGRYNQAVGENLYGDPYGAWGGMFGTNDAGQPIGVGEAQARAINQMMQNNPALSGLQNYQTLAQQERGPVADSTAGLASLMGHPSQFTGGYDQPNFIPATADMGAALNTDFSGSPAPRDVSNQQIDPNLASRGGIGAGVIDAFSGLDPQGLSNLLQFGTALANRGGGGGWAGSDGNGGLPWPLGPMRIMQSPSDFLFTPGRGGGGGGGSLPFDPSSGRNPFAKRTSYLFGTPFVPRTGRVKVHRGERITPAPMNPANQGGEPAPGVIPGQPMIGSTLESGNGRTLALPAPNTNEIQAFGNTAGPPNVMQQLLADPMSLDPATQEMIINRGLEGIDVEKAALNRRMQEEAAASGRLGSGTLAGGLMDLDQFSWEQGQNLRRDVPIQAAIQNTSDLRNAAGLQLQGEQALANQNLLQNQFQQGLYNTDISNMGRIIDSMTALQNSGLSNQLGWWNQLTGLANQGVNFPLQALQSAIQNQMWRIQPTAIAQTPIQTPGASVPVYGGMYGGGYGGGGGGGGLDYSNLVNALSFWAGSQ